jgi:hypothetical protein
MMMMMMVMVVVVVVVVAMLEEKVKRKTNMSWEKGESNTQTPSKTDQEAVKRDCVDGKTVGPAGKVHHSPMLRWRSSSL